MKASIIFLRLIGLGFIIVAILYAFSIYRTPRSPATVSVVQPTAAIPTPEIVQTRITEDPVLIITPTPSPDPVRFYILDNRLDLSSGKSTTWSIRLPEGGELPGTWAGSIAYADGDNDLPVNPFNAHLGTIYSLLGDTTVIRAHSGQIYSKSILFASNLDLYLRISSPGSELSLAEGQQKLQKLIGTTAYLCQSNDRIEPFTFFDPTAGCPGEKVEIQLVAGVIIPRDRVADYDLALLKLKSWLETNYPGMGFEKLDKRDGFLLISCIQKYMDQPNIEGLFPVYNRIALGFRIVK
jgi:hypothetical protein